MNHTQELIRENVNALKQLVKIIDYLPGWEFYVDDGIPQMFVIKIDVPNSLTGEHDRLYPHIFNIPTTTLPYDLLERYVLDRIEDVHRHEAMENFKVNGVAPFFPNHVNGNNIYEIHRR